MAHTLKYYINSNTGTIDMYYKPLEFQPSGNVVDCEHISDLDPDDMDSPDYAHDTTEDKYYQRAIHSSSNSANFTLVMMVDGVYGNGSFTCEATIGNISVQKDGSEVVVTIPRNRTDVEVTDTIHIYYTSQPQDCIYIPVNQDGLYTFLSMNTYSNRKCDGVTHTGDIYNTEFTYTFDTLTDKHDCVEEWVKINVDVAGLRNKFFVQSLDKYAYLEPFNSDSYVASDNKYYRKAQKYVNGQVVNYYKEVYLVGLDVYDKVKYDNQFKLTVDNNEKTLTITNYGRVFMEPGAFYVITLANVDKKTERCKITLRLEDNPL